MPLLPRLKRTLHRALGPERYLRLVAAGYFAASRGGLLRGRAEYAAHHFLPHLVRPGDTAVDVGANLGYYTVPLALLVGPTGRVLAVEPVPLYRRVLERRTRRLPNVTVLPFALGERDGVPVRLALPTGAAPYRHGLMRLQEGGASNASEAPGFEATMRQGSVLFADLDRLDFLKCDVEGYEVPVLPEMVAVIERLRPILQVETEGPNRDRLVELFEGLGYRSFVVEGEQLVPLAAATAPGDVVFVPPARLTGLTTFMAQTPVSAPSAA
ncbi:MAG TPA: FkbM family methyltransferase [Rhodothermales bacterium]|nr:FkbM family methyltransferase [Rhodothermales bacterium]